MFQHFCGPIPALEWYDPDCKSTKKKQELIDRHQEQVSQEGIFDFQEEMQRYCHMDVTVLCLCMDKFCAMFQNLKALDGQEIGVDSLLSLTIAAMAFDGISCQYFLPKNVQLA